MSASFALARARSIVWSITRNVSRARGADDRNKVYCRWCWDGAWLAKTYPEIWINYWWRPRQEYSRADARLCGGFSCWSPNNQRWSHPFFACFRCTLCAAWGSSSAWWYPLMPPSWRPSSSFDRRRGRNCYNCRSWSTSRTRSSSTQTYQKCNRSRKANTTSCASIRGPTKRRM